MKRSIIFCCVFLLVLSFSFFALASSSESTDDQGSGSASKDSNLGDYQVEILSCRLSEDYSGKAVVIVKYKFTNNSDEKANFMFTFSDEVYQDGIGLNKSYVLNDDSYSSDNQSKDIKPGASLEVEVAYELNDETTDIEVEVEELISLDKNIVKKTFQIAD